VLGIEAQLTEQVRVKSLQDHARDLDLYGRGTSTTAPGVAGAAASTAAEEPADAAVPAGVGA